jgi:internalin A
MDQKVESLVGVQNLTGLMSLSLWGHSVSDVNALAGLTSLTHLDLWVNSISDIGPLSGLTALTYLDLTGNAITDISAISALRQLTDLGNLEGSSFRPGPDLNLSSNPYLTTIQPLLENPGLGAGDTVNLSDVNPTMPCAELALLQAKGVTVIFNVCT